METFVEYLYRVEEWPLSLAIGGTWLFPFVESIHVLGAVLVVGAIVMVDLRLLGWAGRAYPATTLLRELVPWAWFAFGVATVTGFGLIITRVSSYLFNPAMQWKMVLLLLAGVNMLYFHRHLLPRLTSPSKISSLPNQYRVSGALSLSFWLGVILAGRWVGHIF